METLRNLTLPQVKELAALLASEFRNRGGAIGLTGTLGSGKTTFAKAFLRHLGIRKAKSPTFVISHQYRRGNRFLTHWDFYRLNHSLDLAPLGLEEMTAGRNLALLEWSDKFPHVQKHCTLVINFKIKRSNKRDVTVKFR